MWIALARLLYCFDFEEVPVSFMNLLKIKANEFAQGDPIDTFKPNWIEHRWAPFPVRIKVRSSKHAALIEMEGKIAAETKY